MEEKLRGVCESPHTELILKSWRGHEEPTVWHEVVQLKRPGDVSGEAEASVAVDMARGDALAYGGARTIGWAPGTAGRHGMELA